MKLQSRLASLGATLVLTCAGQGQAAVVSVVRVPALAPPAVANTAGDSRHGKASPFAAGVHLPEPAWADPTRFSVLLPEAPGPFGLYTDVETFAVGPIPAAWTTGWPQQPAPSSHASPFYSYLLSAGQYVLEVGSFSGPYAASPQVSDVPLPGAIWLFGSGLVAFLVIAGRHKL
jgi:hypothetical protein